MSDSLVDVMEKLGPTVTAIALTVVAIVAAVAAFRSARAAESSAKSAAGIPRRSLIRDVVATAGQVVDWAQAVEAKGEQWKSQQDGFAAATGTYQSGPHQKVQQRIVDTLAEVAPLRIEASAINRDSPQLYAASDDDLSIRLGKLTAALAKLHRIYDEATAALALLNRKAEAEWDRKVQRFDRSGS
jgi:hypothetical protein